MDAKAVIDVNVEPGTPGYADMLDRVARMLEDDSVDNAAIASMSHESFREWLNVVVTRVSQTLGIALSSAAALVADTVQIMRNARSSFMVSYRENYERARRIRPR